MYNFATRFGDIYMKKLGKRYLSLILSVVLCFTTFMSVMVIDAADYKVPGPKLTYSFDKASGTLTVSGTGDMYDFWDSSLRGRVPWNDIKDSIKKVVINEGVTGIGQYAFYNCPNLTTVSLPSTVKEIRGYGVTGGYLGNNGVSYGAFRDCVSLTDINFPEGLQKIGIAAFRGCIALKKVTFPDSLKTFDAGAFVGCSGISEVTFGSGTTELSTECFYNCSNLATINWGPKINTVNKWAFYGTRLTEVNLPNQIESIDERAFGDCYHLYDAYIYNRKCSITNLAFDNKGLTDTQQFNVHGYTGSTAETFAKNRGYTFVALDACKHEHTHINVIKAATCTKDGLQETYCDDCNTVIVPDTVIPATGHDYEVTSTSDDTKVDGHLRQYEKCKTCGYENVVLTHVEAEGSGTNNKKYVWVKGYYDYDCNATCTQSGWEKYTCTVEGCGVTQRNVVKKAGHTVDKWTVTKQPTCVEEGTRTGHCSVCDKDVTETIEKTGHTIDAEHPIKTEDKTETDGHIYKTYACSVCGQQTTQITHTAWVEGQYTPTIVAKVTCTTDGVERDKCDICDETRTVTIPSKGEHTWEATQTIEPTCTTKGQTNYTCTVCGATKRDNVVEALGHDYVEQTDLTVAATCTEPGSKTYKCSRCSSTKKEVVDAKGHFADQRTKVITKKADCENDGAGYATCLRCHEKYDFVIKALGHDYKNDEVEIADKPGHVLSTPICTRCGQKQNAEIVHKEWIKGYYTHRVITEGTCLTGEIYVDTCSICNKTTGNTQGSAPGHGYRMLRVYNEPSTSVGGNLNIKPYSVVYSCKHCGNLVTKTGAEIFAMWDRGYYNVDKIERLSIDNSSYLDVNNDGIINAKDYAFIYNLNKKYLKYQEENANKGDSSSSENA